MKRENIVFIEYCHSCTTHYWCTNHDEARYKYFFEKIKQEILKNFEDFIVCGNVSPYNLKPIIPQLGAFEIIFRDKLIFSKLASLKWPSTSKIINRVNAVNKGLEIIDNDENDDDQVASSGQFNQGQFTNSPKKFLLPQTQETFRNEGIGRKEDSRKGSYSHNNNHNNHNNHNYNLGHKNNRQNHLAMPSIENSKKGSKRITPNRMQEDYTVRGNENGHNNNNTSNNDSLLSNYGNRIKSKEEESDKLPDIKHKNQSELNFIKDPRNYNSMGPKNNQKSKSKQNERENGHLIKDIIKNYNKSDKKPYKTKNYANDEEDESNNNNHDDDREDYFHTDYPKNVQYSQQSPEMRLKKKRSRNGMPNANLNKTVFDDSKSYTSNKKSTEYPKNRDNFESNPKYKVMNRTFHTTKGHTKKSGNTEDDDEDTDTTWDKIDQSKITELVDLDYREYKVTQIELPKNKTNKKKIYLNLQEEGRHILKVYSDTDKLINIANPEIVVVNPGPIKIPLKFEYRDIDNIDHYIFVLKDGKPWTKVCIQAKYITKMEQNEHQQQQQQEKEVQNGQLEQNV